MLCALVRLLVMPFSTSQEVWGKSPILSSKHFANINSFTCHPSKARGVTVLQQKRRVSHRGTEVKLPLVLPPNNCFEKDTKWTWICPFFILLYLPFNLVASYL